MRAMMARLLFGKALVGSMAAACAQPGATAAPIRARPMEGPYDNPQRLCSRMRKAACDEVRGGPELPHRSTCKLTDLPLKGSPALEFQAAQTITATCDNGDDLSKTRLAVKTQAGWFVGAELPDSGFQHHTNEKFNVLSLEAQGGAGLPMLALTAERACIQASAGGDDDYIYARTSSAQLLLLIGIGSSGRPSATLQEVGSGLTILGIPSSERVHRERTLWEDTISQDFAVLPGPILRIEPPQAKRGAGNEKILPTDETEPLCYEGSLSERKGKALRRAGSHPLQFR